MLKVKNQYILKTTEDFVRGEMDNVTLSDNALSLEQMAGGYVLYGCYTSHPVIFQPFSAVAVSWNAETPKDTVVEAQCRVMIGTEWSSWVSFGKWSPFINRTSAAEQKEEALRVENGVLHILKGRGVKLQLRIYLYTHNDRVTPYVRLLAASVQLADRDPEPAVPYGRLIRLPAYSRQVRDPALQQHMDSPAAIISLLNRWGEDLLPEEVTLAMLDHADGSCGNHSFAAAVAGAYGNEAYLSYLDPAAVWEHIKAGDSVALELNYASTEEEAQKTGLPLLPGSFSGGSHQLMPVRGFSLPHDGPVQMLVNDCHAPCDREAEKTYTADDVWRAYSGLALLVSAYPRCSHGGSPVRHYAPMRAVPEAGCYFFQTPEGKDLLIEEDFAGTLAVAIPGETTWATTAHKNFCYLSRGAEGGICIPADLLQPGRKLTVYAIWPGGNALVGQISL